MPQFDFSTYIPQIFWSMIAFLMLYLFINFWFIPRIKGSVLNRRKYISDIEDKVEDMKCEIVKLSKEYEIKLDEVTKKCIDYRDSGILRQKKIFEQKYNDQILKFNSKIKDQEVEFNIQLNKTKEGLNKNLILIIESIVSKYNIDVSKKEIDQYIKESGKK